MAVGALGGWRATAAIRVSSGKQEALEVQGGALPASAVPLALSGLALLRLMIGAPAGWLARHAAALDALASHLLVTAALGVYAAAATGAFGD